ncbi:MAG: hypothetical protein KF756_13510 [Acidobacteria bacterium]|nr:hypothetical protein [Acidobacteriota bacterium]
MLEPLQHIRQPTVESVESCLQVWDTSEKYQLQEAGLKRLFDELCRGHNDVLSVLLKVSVLNDFYSTHIFDIQPVAKHIVALDVSKRIEEGDLTLVNEMALVLVGEKRKNFYSFATKYCSHHNADAFPIYDSYVDKMLKYFRDEDGFASFRSADLRRYIEFVRVIKAFRQYYSLDKFSLREIDIYLWIAGKEAFLRPKGKSVSN